MAEWSLVDQKDPGSIPPLPKCYFFSSGVTRHHNLLDFVIPNLEKNEILHITSVGDKRQR